MPYPNLSFADISSAVVRQVCILFHITRVVSLVSVTIHMYVVLYSSSLASVTIHMYSEIHTEIMN